MNPYRSIALYRTLHDLLYLVWNNTAFYEPVRLKNFFDAILISYMYSRLFFHLLPDPRLFVAFSVYYRYSQTVTDYKKTSILPSYLGTVSSHKLLHVTHEILILYLINTYIRRGIFLLETI